ncbi:MAG: proline dehydrogenase family protein, partial [Planctomycetota bacterium]
MLSRALVSMLPLVPRPVVWRISRRYIAGEGLEDALDVVAELNRHGISGTIDLLGEDSRSEAEARGSLEIYLRGLDEIARREIDCNISVKLSQMGLRFDEGLCRAILRELLEAAEARRNFIRIDMEDSSVTGVTLEIYRELRAGSSAIGAVIQAYLRRSRADIESLLDAPANVRLCKGIYREPAAIAFQDRKEIRDSFTELLELLFSAGARRVGIATHDAPLIDRARKMIQKDEIPAER